MKIYILDAFHPAGVEFAARHAEVVRWDDPRVKNWAEDADGVMVRMTPIRAADLGRARKVKVICKQGVGFDNIDVEAAKAHGIPVLRTPGVNKEAVAEMALALGLAATRRVAELDRRVRAGEKIERPKVLGIEMWQKTVGVVGVGNIGSRVARKWQGAFEARVLGYDPYKAELPCEKIAKLEEMLPQVDLVTLHVPLNSETKHMIGKLFGAGLDVWEVESPRVESPLLKLLNVVATPHAAGGTRETQERSSLQVAEQVVDVLSGTPPLPENRVA